MGGLVTVWLAWLVRILRRARPEFAIGLPLVVGALARISAVVLLSAAAPAARGGDEQTFLEQARVLSDLPLNATESFHALTSTFQVWLFAQELRITDFPEFAMRLLQIGISLTGLVLLAAAVHDLAGPRAARLAAWLVMLEPSSVFFSGLLHKEPFMLLGAGIVVFGGTRFWTRRARSGVLIMLAGAAVTFVARPYAGAMLTAGVAAVGVHGALTRRGPLQRRSLGLAAALMVVLIAATPAVLSRTADPALQTKLQATQDANVTDNSNLKLAPVDFSSRGQVLRNLPSRMLDVVLRPYPWELGSTNQRAGFPGTLAALAAFGLLGVTALRSRGRLLARAGPLLYAGASLFVAFSLSAGNAGTSFRLRSTVVVLVICAVVVLRRPVLTSRQAPAAASGGSSGAMSPPRLRSAPPGAAVSSEAASGRPLRA